MIRETVVQALFSMTLLCLSVLVALVGFGFMVAGLYLGLTHWWPPAGAAAATGFVMLVVALIIVLIAKAVLAPPARPLTEEPPAEDMAGIGGLMAEAAAMNKLVGQLEKTVREHRPLVTASTFAAGFYLGINPKARRTLGRAISDAASQSLGGAGDSAGRKPRS